MTSPSQKTVKLAISEYLKHLRREKHSEGHIRHSKMVLGNLLRACGDRRTLTLTPKKVGRVTSPIRKRVQANTFSVYERIFWKFFEYCKSKRWVQVNHITPVDVPYIRKVAFFTSHQLDFIFSRLPQGPLRDLCLILYHTGIRKADLGNLCLHDEGLAVDFITRQVFFKDRYVFCPEHILRLVAERPWSRLIRSIDEPFTEFMKQFDFEGTLRYLQNSYLMRHRHTPIAVLREQMGFSSNYKVVEKLARLKDIPKGLLRNILEIPFKDYV